MNESIDLINNSSKIVVIQADNPDADSLASSLALEHILGDQGKEVSMYCGVDMPSYLRYLDGWDRVVTELPTNFDLSIIVDTSSLSLLEVLGKTGELKWLKSKPCVVIDHHNTKSSIDFSKNIIDDEAVATGEIIYKIAKENNWKISTQACEYVATSILSDSLGLMSEGTTAESIKIIAELVENGVSLAKLDNSRKQHQKKQPELLKYKGRLLDRVEYFNDQSIALIRIPWEEIEKYSPLYNPSMLVMDEMRQVEKVKLAVAFKSYPDGRITAKIRCNYGITIADKIAEQFGGGGHPYASGFRITDGKPLQEIIDKFISVCSEYIDNIDS